MKKSSLFITCIAIASTSPLLGIDSQRSTEYRKWHADMQDALNHIEKNTGLKKLVVLEVSFPDEKLEALYNDLLSKGFSSEMALKKTIQQSTLEWAELLSKALTQELEIVERNLKAFSLTPYGYTVKAYLDLYSQLPYWKQNTLITKKKIIEKYYNEQVEEMQKKRDILAKEVNNTNVFRWVMKKNWEQEK